MRRRLPSLRSDDARPALSAALRCETAAHLVLRKARAPSLQPCHGLGAGRSTARRTPGLHMTKLHDSCHGAFPILRAPLVRRVACDRRMRTQAGENASIRHGNGRHATNQPTVGLNEELVIAVIARSGCNIPGASGDTFLTTPPALSLPKGGGAIRGIGEKFAANPVTGTGTFSMPIARSPGPRRLRPAALADLRLGAGNGPFGFGWSLVAASHHAQDRQGPSALCRRRGLGRLHSLRRRRPGARASRTANGDWDLDPDGSAPDR